MKKPSWDTEAGRQMWAEGKTDSEIADTFGISTGAVTSFRLKHWGGGNGTRGGEALKETQPKGKGGNSREERIHLCTHRGTC